MSMVIDSMNRHLDAFIRNRLTPTTSIGESFAATSSMTTNCSSPQQIRSSPKRSAVRTKSDNEKRRISNRRSLMSCSDGDGSGSNPVSERLSVPPPASGRSHRSRSWDSAAFGINSPKLAKLSLNVSPRQSRSQERKICVHCLFQAEYDQKQLELDAKAEREKFLPFRHYVGRPNIIVSSADSFSSPSESDSDDDRTTPRSMLSTATHRRRRHKESSSDSDCIFASSSASNSEGNTSGERTSSLSDTDSNDSIILPAITFPLIPSISITQFFDVTDYYTQPSDLQFGSTKTARSGSIANSETDTLVPNANFSDTETSSHFSLTPPPSPRPHCESVSSGYVGCSFPFPCVNLKLNTKNNSSNQSSSDSKQIKRTSLFCGGGAKQAASFMSSAYLEAGAPSPVHQQRSSSIDIPSLHHDLQKVDTAAEDVDISRSLSVDLSIPPMLASRSSSKARFISSFLRKAISKSPLPIARANAQLDLFANLGKERAARYWSEIAPTGDHIWISTGAVSDCYIGEVDCSKSGEKLKCSACHVVVHEGCLTLLRRMTFNCKPTYREAFNKFQKDQNPLVHHHWVHKWRQEGRCKQCGKSFQSKFLNKELVAIACSWCKTAYHNKHGCFTMTQIEEACSMGPLKDVIIPPSWILKLPPRRISTIRKRCFVGQFYCMKRLKLFQDRIFVAKPQAPLQDGPKCPLLIFVNPKSGGNKGAKLLHNLNWLVNPRQVFDLSALHGPRYGLEMYRKLLPRLRVMVCGGDGTVGWVLSTLDSLKWPVYPPIAIVPLGTGNDLGRTLGWGGSYVDEPMSELLLAVAEESINVQLDRWYIEVEPNEEIPLADVEEGAVPQLPLSVMNNYFSIGADAQAALQFHESRTANPEIFNSRIKNRIFYAGIGTQDLFKRTWKDLNEYVKLECDGLDISSRLQELKIHCLLFINIPRYAGGTLPWGNPNVGATNTAYATSQSGGGGSPSHSPQFSLPSFSDGRIEVLGLTAATLAALQVGGRGERIAQCSEVRITTKKAIPAQVDGEPCKLAPSIITIKFHSKVPMLQRISVKNSSSRRGSHGPAINSDPSNICGSPALYTSVLLRLPVAAVSKEEYDQNKQDPAQLRSCAVAMGEVTVESETDLDQVRGIVQRMLVDRRDILCFQSTSDWSFLDYMSSDTVFRVDPTQEVLQSVSDICNIDDCLLLCHSGLLKSPNNQKHKLRDMRLVLSSEAVRIVLSSEDEGTKI